MLEAEGADVAAGSITGALKAVAPLIHPLAAQIAARLPAAGHVHADETSWQVFQEADGSGGNRWWLWTFLTDQVAVFVIDPSRGATAAATALGILAAQAFQTPCALFGQVRRRGIRRRECRRRPMMVW
jgi:transposase